jgi:uncharacterized membrane protein
MFKNSKFLTVVLALSLATNLFIFGAIGYYGYELRGLAKDGQWISKKVDRVENRFLRHLDEEDRRFARGVFDQRRPALRAAFSDLRDARHDVGIALRAEQPDAAQLTAAIDKSQHAADMVNKTVHGVLRDLAQGLSPEARAKIGQHLRDRHPLDHHDND